MADAAEQSLIPIYAFRQGDTLGVVVLVSLDDTVATLAERVQSAVAVRVRHAPEVTVHHQGRVLDAATSVGRAGLAALDRVDVRDAARVAP